MTEGLNETGLRYLKCLIDPFNADPCPNIYECSRPTNIKVVTKTYQAKMLGDGMVSVKPQLAMCNDLHTIHSTSGTVAFTTVSGNTATGLTNVNISSNPYGTVDYTLAGRQARLIACAVKVSYAGIAEYIGGDVVGISTIGGTDCSAYTYTQVDQMESTMPTDFTNQEYCVFWVPTLPEVCAKWRYDFNDNTAAEDVGYNQGVTLAILMKAADSSTTTVIPFNVSVAVVYEIAGAKERGTRFRSSDRVQYERVINLLNTNKTWIGSPSTLIMNISKSCCEGIRASSIGQRRYQDIPLYYVL